MPGRCALWPPWPPFWGCCGTTPDHLRALIQATQDIPLPEIPQRDTLLISSYCQAVALDGRDPVIIGERINPTGKKKTPNRPAGGGYGVCIGEVFQQEEAGAHILDVNVGLPGLDEPAVLTQTVEAIQEVTGLPLQLDTSTPPPWRPPCGGTMANPCEFCQRKGREPGDHPSPGEEVRRRPGLPDTG
ncbi:MAG: hypothetical protein ACLR1T_01475 [Evtepia gabavorous]